MTNILIAITNVNTHFIRITLIDDKIIKIFRIKKANLYKANNLLDELDDEPLKKNKIDNIHY